MSLLQSLIFYHFILNSLLCKLSILLLDKSEDKQTNEKSEQHIKLHLFKEPSTVSIPRHCIKIKLHKSHLKLTKSLQTLAHLEA